MRPYEILFKAADLIEPEGRWLQDNFADGGGFCAAGAIFYASSGISDRRNADIARDVFRKIIRRGNIGHWNDAKGRTQAEVVAALRQAALLAKGKEIAE